MSRYQRLSSIADAERRASKRLPRPVFNVLAAGKGGGISRRENVDAFSRIGFIPRVCSGLVTPGTGIRVLDADISFPMMLSPAGVHAIDPRGETAIASAARACGTLYGLSQFASHSVEAVAAVHPDLLAQLYWYESRDYIERYLERLRRLDVRRLVLTLDWSHHATRDWPSPQLPDRLDLKTMLWNAPHVVSRPGWLFRWIASGGLPQFALPNLPDAQGNPGRLGASLRRWVDMPAPTWDDIGWLRDRWQGTLVLKGILHVEDAVRAADIGADAISVSNHGGNDLDGAVSPLHVLPSIASEVGGRIEVLLDGGVRRGSDVARALALGAKAVLVGRPYLWSFAAGGQQGVTDAINLLRTEFERTLVALGLSSPSDLNRKHLCHVEDGRPFGDDRVFGKPARRGA